MSKLIVAGALAITLAHCLICFRRSKDEDHKFCFSRRWEYSIKVHM